jgi:hypothetical protein
LRIISYTHYLCNVLHKLMILLTDMDLYKSIPGMCKDPTHAFVCPE